MLEADFVALDTMTESDHAGLPGVYSKPVFVLVLWDLIPLKMIVCNL